jgi:hypothetical protein
MKKLKAIPAGRNPKKRGAQRMKEMGYRHIQLWLDPEESAACNRASRKDGKRLATWIREMAVLVATGPEFRRP